jgi:hypothetical protein
LAHISISTYFRPNIHQNGSENLEVNSRVSRLLDVWNKISN